MSTIGLDQTTLQILYNRYKKYLISILIILVCLLIIFLFVIPQVQSFFLSGQKITEKKQTIAILEQNLQVLSGLNGSSVIDNNLTTLVSALPPNKDFVGIITAITQAAIGAGVSVKDYNFTVGNLIEEKPSSEQLSLLLNLTISGNWENAKNFITILNQQFPISDISNVSVTGNDYSLKAAFYYKPFSQVTYDANLPLTLVSQKDQTFIDTLSAQQNSPSGQ